MNHYRQTNPLKKQRMEKRLTQKHMSEKLGITQSQYSNIENGETDHKISQTNIKDIRLQTK